MIPDDPGAEPLSSPLRDLERLAEDIASLAKAFAEAEGTAQALLIAQIMRHLELALDDLSQRQGMLTGTMPWWTHWNGRGVD